MEEFMNWADFLNVASDAIFFLDRYSTLWFLNEGSPLQLYMFLTINEEKDQKIVLKNYGPKAFKKIN